MASMASKKQIITDVERILKEENFTQDDYVISLQGPSVILSQSGELKINQVIRIDLTRLGVLII